ncbi:hypothetical protein JQX13_18715 [Archangium violaceum]|uniref:hypothetical protein n=1 Tax=Archangium violaceum TaxID=83451 RepID=UPI00193C3554|nr:hypothetical protein [Archangium violaceum]QRK11905.1 hypothetical protein JQX13_18715 [Archangium violaceum]
MARSERTRSLLRTLAERQRQEEERQLLLAQVRQRSAELQAILEGMVDAVVVRDQHVGEIGRTGVISEPGFRLLPRIEGGSRYSPKVLS